MNAWKWLTLLITLWLNVGHGLTGNILAVYPHFGFSHFKVVMPILNELVSRGHRVTVISYVKNPQAKYEELVIADKDEDQASTTINVVPLSEHTPTRSLWVLFQEYMGLHHEGQETCERLFASGHVEKVIKRHQRLNYDLLLTEYFNADCQLAIAKILNLPIIGLSTCALMPYYFDRIDLPNTPSYITSEYVGFAAPLTWSERLLNFVQAKGLRLLYEYHSNRADNALIKRYLQVNVDVDEVARTQTAFILGNQHYSLMGSRPLSQQFVEVGGVHITPEAEKKLPANVEQFLQESEEKVLFISWGSMVRASSMDDDKLLDILKALDEQPLRVIWKWEANDLPHKINPKKILLVKWAPQLALLCHPKVVLFWSHGGLLGTTEGVHCGKPMLVTPIYGDQFLNAFAVQNRGMGLKLHYQEISHTSLNESFQELTKASYSLRAQKISQIFRRRQHTPLESAIWSIEHTIEHGLMGAKLLQSPGIDLHWFIYHSIDSICLIFCTLMPFLLGWFYLTGWSFRSLMAYLFHWNI
ncbi:uncharacterized protein Dwil_GK14641 [Drosophila willistoni]|uniref:UDP-glucuronosyltransferase n=1 Tax=Drosophila willistoni TaxID=7260 RepID=B4MVC7_DROWI|nr:UDP-glycosyltransferase UGT5 [Drosophila willistoni]EDW76472.2 uncharacterized protein Dwil_GK14641 [Drosophila willistoni]